MKKFILGAAVSGGILFLFVSQTWIVLVIFWAIITFLAYIFRDTEDLDDVS